MTPEQTSKTIEIINRSLDNQTEPDPIQITMATGVGRAGHAETTSLIEQIKQQRTQTAVAVMEPETPPALEDAEQIPPLTEAEKEPDELRRYEIERTDFWEEHWNKRKNSLPFPTNAEGIQHLVWNDVERDIVEFKRQLYQIVGADRKPSSDTILIFRNEKDADQIRDIGFDTAAAIKGTGAIPFQVAVTMFKMKYKRVLLVGDSSSIAFGMINGAIPIGSIYVSDEFLQTLNEELNHPDGYDEKAIKKILRDYIQSDAIQACSILRSAEAVRENVLNTLTWGIEQIDQLDPRTVIRGTLEGLRRIEVLDGRFPAPLTEKSLWGILGDFVEIAYPTTSACREMLLYQMLPIIGSLLGDAYYLPYGSDKHYPATFALAIGKTSEGKGQAKHHVEDAIRLVDPTWYKSDVHSNPASGEGLIRMLSKLTVNVGGNITRKNQVAIFNSEMVTTFNAAARKDSSLSGHLRGAYDGDLLENFRSDKRNSVTAENYILGFCGTITPQELRDVMPAVDWKNGSANRFLWCIGNKDKNLGRSSIRPNFTDWAIRVRKIRDLNLNTEPTTIDYSPSGTAVWDQWEGSLPEHNDDLLSESQARIRANCARIANLYAQLDERRLNGWKIQIEDRHVEAAIEIVTRSRQSVEWYLTQADQIQRPDSTATQDDVMKLKKAVAANGRDAEPEITKNEVTKLFTHKTAEERDELCVLAGLRMYTRDRGEKGGKPTTVWTWNPDIGKDGKPGPDSAQ
jgi:uncharacterized protein DUF3987